MWHLVRVDGAAYDGKPGWQFRPPTWFPGNLPTQLFRDIDHGGHEHALLAARAARDAAFAHEELPLRLSFVAASDSSLSGMPGVFVEIRVSTGKPMRASWCAAWQTYAAYWPGDRDVPLGVGVRKVRRFGIGQRSFEDALQAAIRARVEATGAPAPDEALIQRMRDYGTEKLHRNGVSFR